MGMTLDPELIPNRRPSLPISPRRYILPVFLVQREKKKNEKITANINVRNCFLYLSHPPSRDLSMPAHDRSCFSTRYVTEGEDHSRNSVLPRTERRAKTTLHRQ